MSPDTHRARFLHSAGFQPFSVEMTGTFFYFSETHSTARLTVPVRRSAQGDKVRACICRKCPRPRATPRGMATNSLSLHRSMKKAKPRFCLFHLTAGSCRRKDKAAAFLFQKILKKGKITLFPFFPYEHTDGGEFFCRLLIVIP